MSDVDQVLRVFTDEQGQHGNPLGVVWDTATWSDARCQERGRLLGFSETIFIDDAARGRLRIFTPEVKFPFAGHPTVGAAWVLHRQGNPVERLEVDAGLVRVSVNPEGATVWARPEWAPPFRLVHVASLAELQAAEPWPDAHDYLWTWLDEAAGLIRARSFVGGAGVLEDEATGAAAIRLCGALGRALVIRQGVGSLLWVAPDADGTVALTGNVALASGNLSTSR